jgi:hypothetical protein
MPPGPCRRQGDESLATTSRRCGSSSKFRATDPGPDATRRARRTDRPARGHRPASLPRRRRSDRPRPASGPRPSPSAAHPCRVRVRLPARTWTSARASVGSDSSSILAPVVVASALPSVLAGATTEPAASTVKSSCTTRRAVSSRSVASIARPFAEASGRTPESIGNQGRVATAGSAFSLAMNDLASVGAQR